MSMKSEHEWELLYKLQDEILLVTKRLSNVVLAGGTGFNRFLLNTPIRYSENLDIFLEPPYDKTRLRPKLREIEKIVEDGCICDVSKTDDNTIKFFISKYQTKLKIEILNINCKRFVEPIDSAVSLKIEHPQELLLYKLASIADRSATRDLFDIYLLLKIKLNKLDSKKLIKNINDKLEYSYGYEYDLKYIIKGIKNTRVEHLEMFVDLTPEYQPYCSDFKRELEIFKKDLICSLLVKQTIGFNLYDELNSVADDSFIDNRENIVEYLNYIDVDNFTELEKVLMINEFSETMVKEISGAKEKQNIKFNISNIDSEAIVRKISLNAPDIEIINDVSDDLKLIFKDNTSIDNGQLAYAYLNIQGNIPADLMMDSVDIDKIDTRLSDDGKKEISYYIEDSLRRFEALTKGLEKKKNSVGLKQ